MLRPVAAVLAKPAGSIRRQAATRMVRLELYR
jgi:hypothetical protein